MLVTFVNLLKEITFDTKTLLYITSDRYLIPLGDMIIHLNIKIEYMQHSLPSTR
jgi:hypothetical protein